MNLWWVVLASYVLACVAAGMVIGANTTFVPVWLGLVAGAALGLGFAILSVREIGYALSRLVETLPKKEGAE